MKLKPRDGLVDARLLENKIFRKQQAKVFLITVALYCTWHASRTAWAYSKRGVKDSNPYFTDQKLGLFDLCFMAAYAFGQFYNGWLGDQSNLKTFLAMGTIISLAGYFVFAILARSEIYNTIIFSICFVLYGLGQSRGFPGSTAILGNWIEAARRGMLLGVWNATSDNVGNILGQQIGRLIIDVNMLHWSNALFIVGLIMIIFTIILLLYLKTHPSKISLDDISSNNEERMASTMTNVEMREIQDDYLALEDSPGEITQGISFWDAWKAPGIIKYSLVYACIKGSTYGLLFWLPDYLQTVMGFGQETATIAATYEIGQFIGAIGLGYLTDRMKKRAIGLVFALYVSACIFIILALLGPGSTVFTFALTLFFAGIFFGGPQVIVGGVVSSDLGEDTSLKNDVRSISTMAGIVNGSGSVAAAVIQIVIPHLKSYSFYVYFGLCLLAAVLLTSTALKEFDERNKPRNVSNMEFELSSRGSLNEHMQKHV